MHESENQWYQWYLTKITDSGSNQKILICKLTVDELTS
jgi:hypothetical protein